MFKRTLFSLTVLGLWLPATLCAQAPQAESGKPTEHVLGTITALDSGAQAMTVKDDKSGQAYHVDLAATRTLLKVPPGAKDLHSASRITAGDLAVGDRVDVRGFKAGDANEAITAKSVVLMSARDLAQKHETERAEWERSTAGTVTAVDPAAKTISVAVRKMGTVEPITVKAGDSVEYTRFSSDSSSKSAPSDFSQIHPGDQLRVIGDFDSAGTVLTAHRVYSGTFRTVSGTISSIAADGKSLSLKNLADKQPVWILLSDGSVIRKMPPEMAGMLARRLSGTQTPRGSSSGVSGGGEASHPTPAAADSTGGGARPSYRGGGGDLSHLIDRIPTVSLSDLKPGDAVMASGAVGSDKDHLIATNVIAGVEPILQSAPVRQAGSSSGSDWSLDMNIPAQ